MNVNVTHRRSTVVSFSPLAQETSIGRNSTHMHTHIPLCVVGSFAITYVGIVLMSVLAFCLRY
jgi:hypothetical protein